MKLQYQLTIAFTTLLVVIMSVTALTIYSLILNLLIQDEQRQLERNGEILVEVLNQYNPYNPASEQQLLQLMEEYDLQMFVYDQTNNQVLLTTLALETVENWVEEYDLSGDEQPLWRAGDERYVVSRIAFHPLSGTELILATPLTDLQTVQGNIFNRLLLVFFIGIVVAVLLSYYLTNRLVTPLTRLKHQLKRIEKRQFENLEEIKASGEIKEVEQSVLEMARELQRYIQSQRHFFQNASHELKTPLMTIQGYAEGIREGVFDKEESDRGLSVMVDEIKRLKKIINEMILLAKLDSEENIYKEELINIEELIKLTKERALPIANEKQISITDHVDPNMKLYADKEKLLQAMMNIVLNGIRHADTQVTIIANQVNESVVITIEDDGQGVSEELMPHLFHRFVKGQGGETGLGLAISRAIIERSEGTITVDKSKLGGAQFTIKF